MQGREAGTRTSFRTVAVLTITPVVGLLIFFGWNALQGGETPREAWRDFRGGPVQQRPDEPTPTVTATEASVTPRADKPRKRRGGDIVLIIDDLGFDGQPLERVMALDPNVNCAILPNGTRAADFAQLLNARGFEILCHLPMEPVGGASPGRDAILTSMADDEIARLTRENIEAVPHARGVNNHMGSRATADRRVMQSVIEAIPEGMYFIDSRTSGKSVAGTVARELDVRTATRLVFLDDVQKASFVRKQIAALAEAAEKRGIAVGIGHPHDVTVRALAAEMPKLRAQGFRFVRASAVVR